MSLLGAVFKMASRGFCGPPSSNWDTKGRCVLLRGVLMAIALSVGIQLVGVALQLIFSVMSTVAWLSFALLFLLFKLPVLFFLVPFLASRLSLVCSRPQFTFIRCPKPVPPGEPLPAAPLSQGTHGPGVTQLQHCLIKLGHMQPSAIQYRSGVYGPRTAEAVVRLQQAMDMTPTGQFDNMVREHLIKKLIPQPPQASGGETTSDPSQVVDEETTNDTPQTEPATLEQPPTILSKKQQLLLEMGFAQSDIEAVLTATNGSLNQAAAWLVARAEATSAADEFPTEWQELLDDLMQMGFDRDLAKAALKDSNGQLKDAIKSLVATERSPK